LAAKQLRENRVQLESRPGLQLDNNFREVRRTNLESQNLLQKDAVSFAQVPVLPANDAPA
jgi:hypothetical protein